jgi:hypothetical protein
MGQVTIYLDAATEKRLNGAIKSAGISKSRWIADLIKEKVATSWPDNVASLAGAWSDLPTLKEIRKGLGKDVKREPL